VADLDVGAVTVPELLERLYGRYFLVPSFQREFKWSSQDVIALADSVLRGRPIGMMTLWEQPADTEEELKPIGLEDAGGPRFFCDQGDQPGITRYAILDGRQRCTALAMVFGGLRQTHNSRRWAGAHFLDLEAGDDDKWVCFKKWKEVEQNQLNIPVVAVSKGLLPLELLRENGKWLPLQWANFREVISSDDTYKGTTRPTDASLERRKKRLDQALAGIMDVKLATYTIGTHFDIGEICEIFETLNTSGMKVGTVDLIHAKLLARSGKALADTGDNETEPFQLRPWIDDLGEMDGAVGWASSETKPEWVAQMVTAAYLGLNSRAAPEPVLGGPISSIKAKDLIRTPLSHWLGVEKRSDVLAQTLDKFQRYVANGRFPGARCPYPIVASVFVGIQWSKSIEDLPEDACWDEPELRSLFRAYFWRNALTGRYDQGVVTQAAADIPYIRETLRLRGELDFSDWMLEANNRLSALMIKTPLPSHNDVRDWLLNSDTSGAKRDALRLLLWTGVKADLLDGKDLSYPGNSDVDLHHLYPKDWIRNNKLVPLREYIDDMASKGLRVRDCTANLMPLSRASNLKWSKASPGQLLPMMNITFTSREDILREAFVDEECFRHLEQGTAESFRKFVEHRAELMASELMRRTEVVM
jgi:hypothetical protein